MKNIKIIMIILIVILVIIIASMFIIKKINTNKEIDELDSIDSSEVTYEGVEEYIDVEEYIEVKNSINVYLNKLNINNSAFYKYNQNGERVKKVTDEYINNYIYQVLSDEYINKNSIDINNVRNYVYTIEEKCFFTPLLFIKKGNTENVKTFGVYGVITTQDYNPVMESYMIVNIDENNRTFSVEQLQNKEQLNSIKVSTPIEIIEKGSNTFAQIGNINEELIREYIDDYKILALAYPEVLYNNFLDESYRNKKYENVQELKEDIAKKREEIIKINPSKYQIEKQDNYTQYMVVDDNEHYYIFNSKSASNYSIILDTYTSDLPQFIEKYNSSTEQQKVALNIDKFFKALNAKDYKYAYNCLADSYKNNYFKTQEEFEIYAEQNFYDNSKVEYNHFDIEGQVYTYSVTLTNEATGEKMNKTFIMQLGTGTDFVLSFNR